jgi:hypothetical protein
MERTKHFRIYSSSAIIMIVVYILLFGCKKEYSDIEKYFELPKIEILPITEITAYSAKSGGNVIDDGGASVTVRGIVWSTSENPTIENNDGKTTDGKGTGIFHSTLVNLLPETNYYIKAYCINSQGVSYSNCLEFTTIEKKYAGGNGTENDPYLIKTPGQLDSIRYNLDKHFKQIADIDLSNFSREEWIPAGHWIPIGEKDYPFTGSYDGNNNKIINLTIKLSGTSGIGLFGFAANAEIKNVAIENIDINEGAGLVGEISEGNIINCHTTGCINGGGGGLVGSNKKGNIIECYSIINITGGGGGLVDWNEEGNISDSYAIGIISDSSKRGGGLVNYNGGKITNSYAKVDVVGGYDVGGLVGSNTGSIINCKAMGNVLGNNESLTCVGGLVGLSINGTITNCIAEGDVTGKQYIGGLVGKNMNHIGTVGYVSGLINITTSYATGKVTGANTAGGLVGWNKEGNITMCYATGEVFSTGEYINGKLDCTGGLVGRHTGEITLSYAIGNVTGRNNVGGLVGYSDVIIKDFGSTTIVGSIHNSYATGNISGVNRIGGLIGYMDKGYIRYCFAIGYIKGEDNVGGLVGYQSSYGTNPHYSYYDTNTSGQNDTGKGTPKTTSEMMQRYTYYPHWDFENIWNIDEGESYPHFRWQKITN